jgi:hypothetical protein
MTENKLGERTDVADSRISAIQKSHAFRAFYGTGASGAIVATSRITDPTMNQTIHATSIDHISFYQI